MDATFKLKRMLLPCGYVLSEPLMSHVATSWEHVCPAWANVGVGANMYIYIYINMVCKLLDPLYPWIFHYNLHNYFLLNSHRVK